jgi:Na+-driven multidrug efflux pump
LLLNLFPDTFLQLYGRDRQFTIETIPVMRVVSVSLLFMSIATVWLNGVTGTANTKINLAIEIIAIVLYCVYVYVVLAVLKLSLVWAWTSELLYWSSIFILAFLYLQSGKWKNKVI